MHTITCILTWPDSASVTAVMEAASPDEEFEVRYAGDQARLTAVLLTRCTPSMFRVFMEDMAAELGATLSLTTSGAYLRWAQ